MISAGNPIAILDCSNGPDSHDNFTKGRIPRAKWLNFDTFRDTTSKFPNMLPTKEQLTNRCTEININETQAIVCYD
jgi:3-mercaptopyruvate sulfurtransferase SseA